MARNFASTNGAFAVENQIAAFDRTRYFDYRHAGFAISAVDVGEDFLLYFQRNGVPEFGGFRG
jgi:hypothetical protein